MNDCDIPPVGRASWLWRDVVHMVGKPDQQQNQQWRKAAYTFRVEMDSKSHDNIMMTSSMQLAWFAGRQEYQDFLPQVSPLPSHTQV